MKTKTAIWKGRQWAVTDYGLECIEGRYPPIPAARLHEGTERTGHPDWPDHMVESKPWIDYEDFITAYFIAIAVHSGGGDPFQSPIVKAAQIGLRNYTRDENPSFRMQNFFESYEDRSGDSHREDEGEDE